MFYYLIIALTCALQHVSSKSTFADKGKGSLDTAYFSMKADGLSGFLAQDVDVFYPLSKNTSEKYPLLVFGHGATAGETRLFEAYSGLLNNTASNGYVIIAPRSCPRVYCYDFYQDMVASFKVAADTKNISEMIDSKAGTGIFGHSMGSLATVKASASSFTKQYNIKGAVALHSGLNVARFAGINLPNVSLPFNPDGSEPSVPIMYITGTNDTTLPAEGCKRLFDQTQTKEKAYINLKEATHREPTKFGQGREDALVSTFFNCMIKGDGASCDAMRNKGPDSICDQHLKGQTEECKSNL